MQPTTAPEATCWYLLDGAGRMVGRCLKNQRGWRFLSNVASHQDGRKFHDCPVDAIPEWANKLSGDAAQFMTADEFVKLRACSATVTHVDV